MREDVWVVYNRWDKVGVGLIWIWRVCVVVQVACIGVRLVWVGGDKVDVWVVCKVWDEIFVGLVLVWTNGLDGLELGKGGDKACMGLVLICWNMVDVIGGWGGKYVPFSLPLPLRIMYIKKMKNCQVYKTIRKYVAIKNEIKY